MKKKENNEEIKENKNKIIDNNENLEKNNEKQNNKEILDLQKKLLVMTKALLEERSKSQTLLNEIDKLKLEKIKNEEIISKIKNENNSLQDSLSKLDPEIFFDNMLKNTKNENISLEDYSAIKTQNQELKNEKNIIEEENKKLKSEINTVLKQNDQILDNLKIENKKLKDNSSFQEKIINELRTKISSLNELFKDYEKNKSMNENEISSLSQEKTHLLKKIKLLENQNETFSQNTQQLKNQFSELIEKKLKLELQFDDYKETIKSDNYIFKGTLLNHKDNKETLFGKTIYLYFTNDNKVYIIVNDDDFFCVHIHDLGIIYLENSKTKIAICFFRNNNKVIGNFTNNENVNNTDMWPIKTKLNKIACEFTQKECNYIMEFFKKSKEKYEASINSEEEKKEIMSYLINDM